MGSTKENRKRKQSRENGTIIAIADFCDCESIAIAGPQPQNFCDCDNYRNNSKINLRSFSQSQSWNLRFAIGILGAYIDIRNFYSAFYRFYCRTYKYKLRCKNF